MSITLDRILEQASDQYPATVAFSPESVTVLLFALSFLESKKAWLDESEDPLDEITDDQWDTIEKLVAGVYSEVFNPMLGMIFPIVTNLTPVNCLPCDGATYAREDYPLLYEILDPAFIVDEDSFTVPDLRRKKPRGADPEAVLDPILVGQTGGAETVALTTSEMPSHQHGLFQTDSLAVAPGELPVLIPFAFALGATDLAGSGVAHDNIDPYQAFNFVMVAQ